MDSVCQCFDWHGPELNELEYLQKWNSLFEQEVIREHFKQKVFQESLFLVGALYHFFKYTPKN